MERCKRLVEDNVRICEYGTDVSLVLLLNSEIDQAKLNEVLFTQRVLRRAKDEAHRPRIIFHSSLEVLRLVRIRSSRKTPEEYTSRDQGSHNAKTLYHALHQDAFTKKCTMLFIRTIYAKIFRRCASNTMIHA